MTHPESPNVPRQTLKEMISKKYKCHERNVILFGFRTKFGGMRSTGYCLIYDTFDMLKKYEPRHRKLKVTFLMGHDLTSCRKVSASSRRRIKSRTIRREKLGRRTRPRGRRVIIKERRKTGETETEDDCIQYTHYALCFEQMNPIITIIDFHSYGSSPFPDAVLSYSA